MQGDNNNFWGIVFLTLVWMAFCIFVAIQATGGW